MYELVDLRIRDPDLKAAAAVVWRSCFKTLCSHSPYKAKDPVSFKQMRKIKIRCIINFRFLS